MRSRFRDGTAPFARIRLRLRNLQPNGSETAATFNEVMRCVPLAVSAAHRAARILVQSDAAPFHGHGIQEQQPTRERFADI